MAAFEGCSHYGGDTRAVEAVVDTAIGHLYNLVGDLSTFRKSLRVDEIGRSEVLGPLLLSWVDIDSLWQSRTLVSIDRTRKLLI